MQLETSRYGDSTEPVGEVERDEVGWGRSEKMQPRKRSSVSFVVEGRQTTPREP